MSTIHHTPTPEVDDFLERYAAFERRAAELHPANKAVLFAALSAAAVTKVIVTFDGFGDSGQIESVEARAAEQIVDLPQVEIEIARAQMGSDEPERRAHRLADAIEALAYGFLEQTHSGWENNQGAYGEFVFDVAEGTITLDYNERFESSENFTHEF